MHRHKRHILNETLKGSNTKIWLQIVSIKKGLLGAAHFKTKQGIRKSHYKPAGIIVKSLFSTVIKGLSQSLVFDFRKEGNGEKKKIE